MVQVIHHAEINMVCNDLTQNGTDSPYFASVSTIPDWLEENCVSTLKEACLFDLICTSKERKLFPVVLPFVEYADSNAITDRVFCELMNLPEPFQNDVIVSLAHKQLSAAQLKTLCSNNITFECYYTLAIYQFQESAYSTDDLRKTLHEFQHSKFGEQLPFLVEELRNLPPSNEQKRLLAEEMMNQC